MKRIFKYPLRITYTQELSLPIGSEILSVANQDDNIVLYALVDDSLPCTHNYQVRIYGTGDVATDEADFVGTVSMHNSRFMFHVFTRRLT